MEAEGIDGEAADWGAAWEWVAGGGGGAVGWPVGVFCFRAGEVAGIGGEVACGGEPFGGAGEPVEVVGGETAFGVFAEGEP